MNDEDRLLPRIGELTAAEQALDFVRLSLTQRPESGGEGDASTGLGDLVVALSNLAAVLVQVLEALSRRDALPVDGLALLEVVRVHQQLHAARDELANLDDGMPFDA